MPPKKNEPPPPPPEDTNPFGTFVTIAIPSGALVLDPPVPEKGPRKTHVTLHIPGSHVPWASQPMLPGEDGAYHYSVEKHLRRPSGMDGLQLLINGKVQITIVDSDTNTPLAATAIDELWGFAIARNNWSAANVALTPSATLPDALPKVKSATLASVAIQLQQRQAPEGVDPNAPPPEGTQLPPLLPFSYISEDIAATVNMVELTVHELGPAPGNLQAVVDAAGGKMSFQLGLKLPGAEGPTVAVAMACAGGALALPAVRRELMLPGATPALLYHCEDGVPLVAELARYLQLDGYGDPAWEAYHAAAPLDVGGQLLEAGATECSAAAPLAAFGASGAQPCLPHYAPPPGKSKPIEEAQPAGACAWATAGAAARVSLRFARPIQPPWQPPPKPAHSLAEMIPMRDLAPKQEPTTATDEFKVEVLSIAKALAQEYTAAFPGALPAAAAAAAGADGGDAAAVVEARHKALVFELNRSGKYLQIKDSLKAAVVSIVRERFKKSGSMSPNEMALLYNDLYSHLLTATHAALNELVTGALGRSVGGVPTPPPPPAVPGAQELAALLDLAAQAEARGEAERAEALHQRRLLAKNDPQVWYEYGLYCLRQGARGRGEQCFREALSLDSSHRPALLALLGCSVAEGRATDPLYLEAAEAAAHRLLEVAGGGPGGAAATLEPWAALALVYKAYPGDVKRVELASCEQEMARLERVVASGGGGSGGGGGLAAESSSAAGSTGALQAAALLALAMQLLDVLALPGEALLALDMAAALRQWAGLTEHHAAHALGVALCQQALGRGQELLASERGPELHRLVRTAGGRAKLLAAQLHRSSGAAPEAIRYYQRYVEEARDEGRLGEVALPVWLQLAGCYSQRGEHRYAADVFMLGAGAAPRCAALWRGAGEAFLAAGDLRQADMALTEANLLDAEDPLAWGLLALVALRQGRQADGERALGYALRCGLADPGVLLDVAEEYRAAGRLRAQQGVLQEVAGRLMPESCGVRLLLARCLLAQRATGAAAEQVAAAKALAVADEDEAAVADLEAQLAELAVTE